MGFDVESELAEFFEGDSPDYSLELDGLHRRDLVFLQTALTFSAIMSKRQGDRHVHDWKMDLAGKVHEEIPSEVEQRMDELDLLIQSNGGYQL